MKIRTSKVFARYGEWVVTAYGVENTTRPYPIEATRVHEQDWLCHMAGKVWCQGRILADFAMALHDARCRFSQKQTTVGGRA